MKRMVFFAVILAISASCIGQKSVDALFDRYAGSEGFVSVSINGNLLRLAKALCDDDDDDESLPADVTSIRILVQEDENLEAGNFYDMVEKDLDRKEYEEFMRIKEHDRDLIMLVRTTGKSIKEFLVVAGGEDNVLIQIKGNMTLSEAQEFSENIRKDNGTSMVYN